MLEPRINSNKTYLAVDYREREEEDYFLVFVNDTERCYKANKTGSAILTLLSRGATVEQASLYLAEEYGLRADSIRTDIVEYVTQLLSNRIVSEVEREADPCGYAPPSLVPLEEVLEKAKQCRMFGMP